MAPQYRSEFYHPRVYPIVRFFRNVRRIVHNGLLRIRESYIQFQEWGDRRDRKRSRRRLRKRHQALHEIQCVQKFGRCNLSAGESRMTRGEYQFLNHGQHTGDAAGYRKNVLSDEMLELLAERERYLKDEFYDCNSWSEEEDDSSPRRSVAQKHFEVKAKVHAVDSGIAAVETKVQNEKNADLDVAQCQTGIRGAEVANKVPEGVKRDLLVSELGHEQVTDAEIVAIPTKNSVVGIRKSGGPIPVASKQTSTEDDWFTLDSLPDVDESMSDWNAQTNSVEPKETPLQRIYSSAMSLMQGVKAHPGKILVPKKTRARVQRFQRHSGKWRLENSKPRFVTPKTQRTRNGGQIKGLKLGMQTGLVLRTGPFLRMKDKLNSTKELNIITESNEIADSAQNPRDNDNNGASDGED